MMPLWGCLALSAACADFYCLPLLLKECQTPMRPQEHLWFNRYPLRQALDGADRWQSNAVRP